MSVDLKVLPDWKNESAVWEDSMELLLKLLECKWQKAGILREFGFLEVSPVWKVLLD